MSETLIQSAVNVRYLMRDRKAAQYAVDTPELYRCVISNAQRLAAECGHGAEWIAGIATLTVGSLADITLLTTVEYRMIGRLRIAETQWQLDKLSLNEINDLRIGLTSSSSQGDPTAYAMWEDESQHVKIRLNTVPSTARTLDALRESVVPEAYTDATVLPFVSEFLRVIEKAAALELVAKLSMEEVQRIQLNLSVLPQWKEDVERGMHEERRRKARLQRRGYGVGMMAWR